MFKILKKFFDFCGKINKRKFRISIALGAVQAIGCLLYTSAPLFPHAVIRKKYKDIRKEGKECLQN